MFAFVQASWTYAAFVVPLVVLAFGLGLANGPSSSVATSCVTRDQVGAACGISDMGRYAGSAVLTAALFSAVYTRQHTGGAAGAEAFAARFSRAAIALALFCAFGIALTLLAGRIRPTGPPTAALYAVAAASQLPHRPHTAHRGDDRAGLDGTGAEKAMWADRADRGRRTACPRDGLQQQRAGMSGPAPSGHPPWTWVQARRRQGEVR